MYEKILFPVQYEETSDYAIEFVADVSETYHANVYVLHVVHSEIEAMYSSAPSLDSDEVASTAREYVYRIQSRLSEKGISAHPRVEYDTESHGGILKFFEKEDIDLLIMESHGRQHLSRMFLGSTTERVLRRAQVPVMTIPQVSGEEESSGI